MDLHQLQWATGHRWFTRVSLNSVEYLCKLCKECLIWLTSMFYTFFLDRIWKLSLSHTFLLLTVTKLSAVKNSPVFCPPFIIFSQVTWPWPQPLGVPCSSKVSTLCVPKRKTPETHGSNSVMSLLSVVFMLLFCCSLVLFFLFINVNKLLLIVFRMLWISYSSINDGSVLCTIWWLAKHYFSTQKWWVRVEMSMKHKTLNVITCWHAVHVPLWTYCNI